MADETWGVARALWEKVNEEREDRGWTWSELSRRSGVRRATIASLASGKEPPQPDNINKLADTLGLDRKEAHRLARGNTTGGDLDETSVRTSIAESRRLNGRQKALLLNLYDELVSGNQEEQPPGHEPLRIVDSGSN